MLFSNSSLTYTFFVSNQVVRGDFIVYFNQIFDALCKLSADSDANVQSAAHLLDRLVKVCIECHVKNHQNLYFHKFHFFGK